MFPWVLSVQFVLSGCTPYLTFLCNCSNNNSLGLFRARIWCELRSNLSVFNYCTSCQGLLDDNKAKENVGLCSEAALIKTVLPYVTILIEQGRIFLFDFSNEFIIPIWKGKWEKGSTGHGGCQEASRCCTQKWIWTIHYAQATKQPCISGQTPPQFQNMATVSS